MFGMGFGEFTVLLMVALVIFGPKELPKYLRKAGQIVGQVRNWALDMRQKSGIDEVLRMEGLERDIAELRRLTRGEISGLVGTVHSAANTLSAQIAPKPYAEPAPQLMPPPPVSVDREREYPRQGPDAYGALPDTAVVDAPVVPSSLADDAVYAQGATVDPGPRPSLPRGEDPGQAAHPGASS